MYWSPERVAVVRRCPTSEPPPGWVMASEPISSPANVGRTKVSISRLSPEAMMCGTAMPQVNSEANTPPGTPAWCSSSQTITASAPSPPPPPTSSGKFEPSRPASPAARCNSRGNSPRRSHSSTLGRISRSAKERTVFRSASRSGVVQMLTKTLLSQQHCWNVDVAAAQPLAESFGLRVEPCLVCDALAEDLLDDEVHRAQVGQQMPGHRQTKGLGQ